MIFDRGFSNEIKQIVEKLFVRIQHRLGESFENFTIGEREWTQF